jgi:hypothetical protein
VPSWSASVCAVTRCVGAGCLVMTERRVRLGSNAIRRYPFADQVPLAKLPTQQANVGVCDSEAVLVPHYQRTRVLCKRGNHWCHCYGLLTCTAVGTCLTCTAVGTWDLHVCCCSIDTMHAQESESKYEQCSTILHGAQQQLLCSRLGQCFSPTVTAPMLPLSASWWSWHQLHAQSPAAPSRWPAAKQWQQQIQHNSAQGYIMGYTMPIAVGCQADGCSALAAL